MMNAAAVMASPLDPTETSPFRQIFLSKFRMLLLIFDLVKGIQNQLSDYRSQIPSFVLGLHTSTMLL